MTTLNQSLKIKKIKKIKKISFPQKKVIIDAIINKSPRNPNSGIKKTIIGRIKETNKRIEAYIPGQGHNLSKFNKVLIKCGRTKDLRGFKYKIIRHKLDFTGKELIERKKKRSKYSKKKKNEI